MGYSILGVPLCVTKDIQPGDVKKRLPVDYASLFQKLPETSTSNHGLFVTPKKTLTLFSPKGLTIKPVGFRM